MEQVFKIEETAVVQAKTAGYISLPTFFLDTQYKRYRATVRCFDTDGAFVANLEVQFTQEEFDKWGTDDTYIYNLIHEKLGTKQVGSDTVEL